MPIYDYICELGHKVELRRGMDITSISCPLCDKPALRVPFSQGLNIICHGRKPEIRNTYKNYQEASAEIDYVCNKFESETNAKVPDLGLWQQAKQKARGQGINTLP
jgi:putative FmdB family regulatory protein